MDDLWNNPNNTGCARCTTWGHMGKKKWGGSRGRMKKRLFMTGYQNSGTGQNRPFWFSHSVSHTHTLARQSTIGRICCARWTQLSRGCGVMFTFTAPSRAGDSGGKRIMTLVYCLCGAEIESRGTSNSCESFQVGWRNTDDEFTSPAFELEGFYVKWRWQGDVSVKVRQLWDYAEVGQRCTIYWVWVHQSQTGHFTCPACVATYYQIPELVIMV